MKLDSNDMSIARIALIAYSHRCTSEAAFQRDLATRYPSDAEQCERNAKASEELGTEAASLAERIRVWRREN